MSLQGGGSAPVPLGLTNIAGAFPGLGVDGYVHANGFFGPPSLRSSAHGTFLARPSGGVEINKNDDNANALAIRLSPGSTTDQVFMNNSDGITLWDVFADGSQTLLLGLGEYGVTPPSARPIVSGTLTGATLAQLINVVSQILTALDAKGTVDNQTT